MVSGENAIGQDRRRRRIDVKARAVGGLAVGDGQTDQGEACTGVNGEDVDQAAAANGNAVALGVNGGAGANFDRRRDRNETILSECDQSAASQRIEKRSLGAIGDDTVSPDRLLERWPDCSQPDRCQKQMGYAPHAATAWRSSTHWPSGPFYLPLPFPV